MSRRNYRKHDPAPEREARNLIWRSAQGAHPGINFGGAPGQQLILAKRAAVN